MRTKILIGMALTLIIAVFIGAYWATEPARQEAARERLIEEAVGRGAELYISNCAACHGVQGQGRIGPALQGTELDENALIRIISAGVPGTVMSAWSREEGGPLTIDQIEDLATFIKNWDTELVETLTSEDDTEPGPTSVPTMSPTATPAWTPVEALTDIQYDPTTPESILLRGKRTFQSSCSACHDLPSNEMISSFSSDQDFLILAIEMTELAELPPEYAEMVIRYLLAVRHGIAP